LVTGIKEVVYQYLGLPILAEPMPFFTEVYTMQAIGH
jgi:hypothetical protein